MMNLLRFSLALVCALISGCLTMPSRYSLQTFDLNGGSLVIFNCYVDQYSKTWRAEAESKARAILATELAKLSQPRESTVVLDISLSEGGWADVFAAVGTDSFTKEWKTKGSYAAGLKTVELRTQNYGPSFVKKGHLSDR